MKGFKDYERFKKGETLTHRQAILAQCYVCNGLNEGGEDCKGASCPLYRFMPYRTDKKKRQVNTKQLEALERARQAKIQKQLI